MGKSLHPNCFLCPGRHTVHMLIFLPEHFELLDTLLSFIYFKWVKICTRTAFFALVDLYARSHADPSLLIAFSSPQPIGVFMGGGFWVQPPIWIRSCYKSLTCIKICPKSMEASNPTPLPPKCYSDYVPTLIQMPFTIAFCLIYNTLTIKKCNNSDQDINASRGYDVKS